MDLTSENKRRFEAAAASGKRKHLEKKQREAAERRASLGLKVIRGGKQPGSGKAGSAPGEKS